MRNAQLPPPTESDAPFHDPTGVPVAVVPRWEWRAIARSLPIDVARLALEPGTPTAGSETYLLSALTPHNVKVRKQVLEIKSLERRTTDGLELWRPTAQSPFPLDDRARTALWNAWGISPQPAGATVSLDVLLQEVVAKHDLLRRVDLIKHRTRLSLAGCAGELVDLEIGAERRVSLAFEDADPRAVRAALTAAGLEGFPNLNYPAALKEIVGLPITAFIATEGAR